MTMRRRCLQLTIVLALLSGTAIGQPQGPLEAGGSASPPPMASTLSSEEALTYRLGPGDQLRVITYDEPQLTGNFNIGSTGSVVLPLIGEVPAQNRTIAELQADIVRLLKDGYIKDPSISIEVMTFRPFYILGEVNKPGQYPYTTDLTVENAVATAGGFTYRANERNIFVKHQGQPGENKVHVTPDTKVLPGDTVRVVERYF